MANHGREVDYYYNKDNRDNRNNIQVDQNWSTNSDNGLSPSFSGISPGGEENPQASTEATCSGVVAPALVNSPDLNADQIKRAIVQFFDNGETAYRRFKIKIRLNLTDGDNPEFIANLTKDWSNFSRYIPAECKDQLKPYTLALRNQIRADYNAIPYLGKFHLAQTRSDEFTPTQIEPWTYVAVWFNQSTNCWQYQLQIQDWSHAGELSQMDLTAKQIKYGVKAQDLYINPKLDNRQKNRPKTWAQLRAERNAK